MIILVSGPTQALQRNWSPNIGGLINPRRWAGPEFYARHGIAWAMDNDCFQGLDRVAYISMLKRCQGVPGCLWVTVPDVVADSRSTLLRFRMWASAIRYYGYKLAFVGQDDCEHQNRIPWNDFECFFIGGTTHWKLSHAVEQLVYQAKERGKWVHMGRVNSRKRLAYAHSIGCDSVDGTGFSRYGDTHLPWAIDYASFKQERILL